MSGTRIAVVDDHPLFRRGVIAILKSTEGMEIVGEGSSADDAVRVAEHDRPNVILLDVSIPGGGINALRRILAGKQKTVVIMLTVSDNGEDVLLALETGAAGYLLKGIQKAELINAVRSAIDGNTVIDPRLAVRIIRQLSNTQPEPSPAAEMAEQLNTRECQVLDCVA